MPPVPRIPHRIGSLIAVPTRLTSLSTSRVARTRHGEPLESEMVQLPQPIETPRLVLRPFVPSDLDDLASILADESVNRYLYREPCNARRDCSRHWTSASMPLTTPEESKIFASPSLYRRHNRLIGHFMLHWNEDVHHQGEMGGSLQPRLSRSGVRERGVRSTARSRLYSITTFTASVGDATGATRASVRSLEKAGLRQEAHFVENEFVKGEWTDEIVLAILQSEWRAAQGL